MKIVTVQAHRGANEAAQIIMRMMVLLGCPLEVGRNDVVITYDDAAKQATLESNESTLSAYFKVSGQSRIKSYIGHLTHTREISGYMIHPIIKESIPNYKQYINVCVKGVLSCQ